MVKYGSFWKQFFDGKYAPFMFMYPTIKGANPLIYGTNPFERGFYPLLFGVATSSPSL